MYACTQVTQLDDHMIPFLASLPDDEHAILMQIFKKYENCDMKDQKLSHAQRVSRAKLDCRGTFLKPLRGIDVEDRRRMLLSLNNQDMSFGEVAKACAEIKSLKKVIQKSSFMNQLDIKTCLGIMEHKIWLKTSKQCH